MGNHDVCRAPWIAETVPSKPFTCWASPVVYRQTMRQNRLDFGYGARQISPLPHKLYTLTIKLFDEDLVWANHDYWLIKQQKVKGPTRNVGDQDVSMLQRRYIVNVVINTDTTLGITAHPLGPIFPLYHNLVEATGVHLNEDLHIELLERGNEHVKVPWLARFNGFQPTPRRGNQDDLLVRFQP